MPRDIFNLAYSVKMSADKEDTAEILLYGEIVEDMPSWWKWSKEDKSASEFDAAIKDIIAKGATKLLVKINSPGGVCTQAVAMRSILANAGFEEIKIRIEGMCASAATFIATLPGATVEISQGSEYMIHNPWCSACGTADELDHVSERLRNIEQTARGFYSKKTGHDENTIKEWMDSEKWFTSKQAVELGFADKEINADAETPAAACVSRKTVDTMKALYTSIPKDIENNAKESPAIDKPENKGVSNGNPVAGNPSEIIKEKENKEMPEVKDITLDQLKDGNPELFNQIRQSAVNDERARLDEIDAITIPGYENLAAEAKQEGTSAMDFHKKMVAEMKQKGNKFLEDRKDETTPAKDITGGTPEDSKKTDAEKEKEFGQSLAAYANDLVNNSASGMY